MIEGIQLVAIVAVLIMLVIALIDMGMNGARYASGWPFVIMGFAGVAWLLAESAR